MGINNLHFRKPSLIEVNSLRKNHSQLTGEVGFKPRPVQSPAPQDITWPATPTHTLYPASTVSSAGEVL